MLRGAKTATVRASPGLPGLRQARPLTRTQTCWLPCSEYAAGSIHPHVPSFGAPRRALCGQVLKSHAHRRRAPATTNPLVESHGTQSSSVNLRSLSRMKTLDGQPSREKDKRQDRGRGRCRGCCGRVAPPHARSLVSDRGVGVTTGSGKSAGGGNARWRPRSPAGDGRVCVRDGCGGQSRLL